VTGSIRQYISDVSFGFDLRCLAAFLFLAYISINMAHGHRQHQLIKPLRVPIKTASSLLKCIEIQLWWYSIKCVLLYHKIEYSEQ